MSAQAALARERAVGDPNASLAVTVEKNGYTFKVDTLDRSTNVNGDLTLENATRSRANQSNAGGDDRLPSDDGGHFIAARFNGPNNAFNHFAQDASFNRGQYRALEDKWARDLRAGQPVSVDITAHYPDNSTRPDSLTVRWTAGGKASSQSFSNGPKGRSGGH